MRFLTRRWTLLCLLVMSVSLLFSACGDNPRTAPAVQSTATQNTTSASGATAAPGQTTIVASATTAAVQTTAAANSGPATDLTLWILPLAPEGAAPPADWEGYKIIKDKLNINLKLTLLPVGADGDTKLNTAAAANSLPDIFQMSSTNNQLFTKWYEQGLLAPVDSLLPMMPERTKLFYSNPTVNKLVTVNGKMYALQAPAQLTTRQGLFIRQDWLDKLGLKAPTNLDEFLDVAKAFTEKDPDGNGKNDTYGFGALIDSGSWLWRNFEFIYGAYGLPGIWNYDNPTNFGLNVRDPNYEKATEYIKKLNDAKVIDPDWPTLKTDDFRARWKQGKYGMFVEDFAALSGSTNYKPFDDAFPNGQLVLLAPPKGPDGKAFLGSYPNTGIRLGISKKAIDAGRGPAIAKFLEWASQGEGYYLLSFGKEGVNYKKDAQGNISLDGVPTPITSPAAVPVLQLRNIASNGNPAELKIRYPSYQTKAGRIMDPLKIYQTLNSYPWRDTTADLSVKPAANQVDITRYISENQVQFILGQKPLNDGSWKDFLNGLNGLGVPDWETSAKQTLQQGGFLK